MITLPATSSEEGGMCLASKDRLLGNTAQEIDRIVRQFDATRLGKPQVSATLGLGSIYDAMYTITC